MLWPGRLVVAYPLLVDGGRVVVTLCLEWSEDPFSVVILVHYLQ